MLSNFIDVQRANPKVKCNVSCVFEQVLQVKRSCKNDIVIIVLQYMHYAMVIGRLQPSKRSDSTLFMMLRKGYF